MDSLQSVGDCGGETNAGQEVGGLLVVASCDAAPILEAIEGALDDVAHPVGNGVVRLCFFAVGLGRYDGFAAVCSQIVSDVVCFIGYIFGYFVTTCGSIAASLASKLFCAAMGTL